MTSADPAIIPIFSHFSRTPDRRLGVAEIGEWVSCHHILSASTGFAEAAFAARRQQPSTAARTVTGTVIAWLTGGRCRDSVEQTFEGAGDEECAYRSEQHACGGQHLTGPSHLLPNDAPEGFLEWFPGVGDMLPQRIVDQALVVAAPRSFNLGSKPGNHVFIKPDSNSRFSFGNRNNRAAFCFRKIIFAFHFASSYRLLARRWFPCRDSAYAVAAPGVDSPRTRPRGVQPHGYLALFLIGKRISHS